MIIILDMIAFFVLNYPIVNYIKKEKQMKSILLMVSAMFLLFSCSVKQVTEPKTERIFKDAEIRSSSGDNLPLEDIIALEERVKTYWDARMEGNGVKMYELEDPDVIKDAQLSLSGYIQSKSPAIVDKGYEVKGLEILSPEKVRVRIILQAFINLPQVMKEETALIRDIWQKKHGQWFRWLVLNPFDALPMSDRQKIKVKPYDGPVGDIPKSGTTLEIKPKEEKVPGEDLNKKQ
jgi:hypothetical protein